MLDLFAEPSSELLYADRYPMRPHPSGVGHIIEVPDGELYYAPDFFNQKVSDRALQVLLANDRYPVLGMGVAACGSWALTAITAPDDDGPLYHGLNGR